MRQDDYILDKKKKNKNNNKTNMPDSINKHVVNCLQKLNNANSGIWQTTKKNA